MKVFGFLIFLIIGGSEMMESAADAPIEAASLPDDSFGRYLVSRNVPYIQTFSNRAGILCDFENYPVVSFKTLKFDMENREYQLKCVLFGVTFQQADFDNCMNRAKAQRGEVYLLEAHNCLKDINSYE